MIPAADITPEMIATWRAREAELNAKPVWGRYDVGPARGSQPRHVPPGQPFWIGTSRGTIRPYAQRDLGQAYDHDRSGLGVWAKGLAVALTRAEVHYFRGVLQGQGIAVFVDGQAIDLDMYTLQMDLPTEPPTHTTDNMHAAAVQTVSGPSTKSRGLRLPVEIWDALEVRADTTGRSISELLLPVLEEFLQLTDERPSRG